jgi:uncharacterized membrane protein HdeD (DUF308 family)
MPDPFHAEIDRQFGRFGITGAAAAILMIVFGFVILIRPELVGILVGIYLVVVGILQLLATFEGRPRTSPPPTTPRIP